MTERAPSDFRQFDEILPFQNEQGRNDRFTYAKVRRGDTWYFLKTAQHPDLQENLQREYMWAEFMDQVAIWHPEAQLRAPHIVGFEPNGGLLMEYIDAPHVAESNNPKAWRAQMERYAKTLAVLDECAGRWNINWPDSRELSGVQDIDKVWRKWLGSRYDEITGLAEAKKKIDASLPTLDMRVQHGDLTPWQMFHTGEEWVIYDGEKSGSHLPRFNDVAYGYGRLFTRFQDQEAAAQLLERFIYHAHVDESAFFKAFLPVMTFRAVGMVADAYGKAYDNNAQELLQICINGNASDFLHSH